MTRAARINKAEWRRIVKTVREEGVTIEVSGIKIVPPSKGLPEDGRARNANGFVEARLADAPWTRK